MYFELNPILFEYKPGKRNCRINGSDYINELQTQFSELNFNRIKKSGSIYITNPVNKDLSNDSKIFIETQAKRLLCSPVSPFVSRAMKKKLSYFSQEEDKDSNKIFKMDSTQNLKSDEKYVVQNIGHATQLIQIPEFNILTDPVFGSLNRLLYPLKTESHPSIKKLPIVDVIIISHNHRDHVDRNSLIKLLEYYQEKHWPQPEVFVPLGDGILFKSYGFNSVQEVNWYTKISVSKEISNKSKTVHFVSVPADHRSGRNGIDHHKSLVNGWLINPENDEVIFKFSGDTRSLSDENQQALNAVMWFEIMCKTFNKNVDNIEIPDIICLEPSGPNYTRSYMDITHQSTSYSALLKFIEAENLAKISGKDYIQFLGKIKTIMMHHNKFELGPDRFNEGLFIFKKLIQYLDKDQDLEIELTRQKRKIAENLDKVELKNHLPITSRPLIATLPEQTSLLVHAKDFIITDIKEVLNEGIKEEVLNEGKISITGYLLKNTIFPKIGERFNNIQINNTTFDVESINKYRRYGKSRDDKI